MFRVDLHQDKLAQWQQHPRLRRVSPITFFMMEAAQQALDDSGGIDNNRLGIVVALSGGCFVYMRRFFQDMLREGRRFASPLLFPETVYNAPASHVASVLKIPGPCYSVVGDGSAWVTAIATAACWLELGQLEHVLVLGAEELDAVALEAFQAVGWSKKGRPFVAAEGAGALLLRRSRSADRTRITAMAEGFTYRNKAQARRAASECLKSFGDSDVHFHRSAQNTWLGSIEEETIRRQGGICEGDLPYCGEAFSASAAWHTVRALSSLSPERSELRVPVWGLNEQISALHLSLTETESSRVGSREAIA